MSLDAEAKRIAAEFEVDDAAAQRILEEFLIEMSGCTKNALLKTIH